MKVYSVIFRDGDALHESQGVGILRKRDVAEELGIDASTIVKLENVTDQYDNDDTRAALLDAIAMNFHPVDVPLMQRMIMTAMDETFGIPGERGRARKYDGGEQ